MKTNKDTEKIEALKDFQDAAFHLDAMESCGGPKTISRKNYRNKFSKLFKLLVGRQPTEEEIVTMHNALQH